MNKPRLLPLACLLCLSFTALPAAASGEASQHAASGVYTDVELTVINLLGDVLEIGPLPVLEASGSAPFEHSESLLEIDVDSPLGLIELSTGPLSLDAEFGGAPGPSVTTAGIADLGLFVRLLNILGLGDLLELSLTADAVASRAEITGACGDLHTDGSTHIANGQLVVGLLGALGIPLPIELDPPPNTGIDLDVLGLTGATLYLNEQVVSGDGEMESSIQVNALRLAVNVDISIEVILPVTVAKVNLELIAGQSSASRNCNTVNLEATLAADPETGEAGSPLTYTAGAVNHGPETARGARVVFTRPDSTAFGPAALPDHCALTYFNQVTCELGTLPPGDSAQVLIEVTPSLPGELLARAEVESAELDTDTGLNASELITPVPGPGGADPIFSDRFQHLE